MAEHIVAELMLRRHILKYVARKLNPDTAHTVPYSAEMGALLRDLFPFPVRTATDTHQQPPGQRGRLRLTVDLHPPEIDPHTHKAVVGLMEDLYQKEFCTTVDQLHHGLRVQLRAAVESFRHQYGITEDDLPLCSSMRYYRRYQNNEGRELRPGRVMLPEALLKNPRKRDLLLRAESIRRRAGL